MLKFLLVRLLTGLLVLLIISMVIFGLFYLIPSDVARAMAGKGARPETIALINHRLGLDQPIYVQYGRYMGNLLHGDLGYSYYDGRPVTGIIKSSLPVTGSIALGAAVIWLGIGVTSGVISAVRPRSIWDRLLTFLALFFFSMPTFVLGLFLLYFFYYKLTMAGYPIFPASGYAPLFGAGLNQWFFHLVLPWFTVALISAATYTRLTRSSMLDVLSEDYIRTARAKGISERRVNYRHGLRSALTPVVTQLGVDLGALIGGIVVTETVFSMDGLGYEALSAIGKTNRPVIAGIMIFAAFVVVVTNFLVDILYAVLDPRVRLS